MRYNNNGDNTVFKLYNMLVRKLILEHTSEEFVIINMEKSVSDNCDLLVVGKKDKKDEPIIRGVKNYRDYEIYKQEYEYRTLTGMSCFDLKNGILDKAKTKKRTR